MGLFKVVVLVFSLYLATVVADEVTCESESGGTCNLASNDCRIEHATDTHRCALTSRSLTYPIIPNTPACTYGACPGQPESSSCSIPTAVHVWATVFDSTYFNVHVSWSVAEGYPVYGFRVRLRRLYTKQDNDLFDLDCVCLNATERNYTFNYNSNLQYSNPISQLWAQVSMLPCEEVVTGKMPFPSSCNDLPYDPIHCRPPPYSSPRNVHAYRSVHHVGETSTENIQISWEPPDSPYREPTTYYVQVNNHDVGDYILKATNTTSVSVHHLNTSVMYQVRVRTYVPCSGSPSSHGCSFATSWVQVMSEPSSSVILPTPMLSSTMVATTTVSTLSPVIPESGTPPSGNNIAIPVASSVGGALLVVIISSIIARRMWVHKQSSYGILLIDDHGPPRLIVQSGYPQHDCNETLTVKSAYPQHNWTLTLPVQSDHSRQNASHTALVIYSLD